MGSRLQQFRLHSGKRKGKEDFVTLPAAAAAAALQLVMSRRCCVQVSNVKNVKLTQVIEVIVLVGLDFAFSGAFPAVNHRFTKKTAQTRFYQCKHIFLFARSSKRH